MTKEFRKRELRKRFPEIIGLEKLRGLEEADIRVRRVDSDMLNRPIVYSSNSNMYGWEDTSGEQALILTERQNIVGKGETPLEAIDRLRIDPDSISRIVIVGVQIYMNRGEYQSYGGYINIYLPKEDIREALRKARQDATLAIDSEIAGI